MPVADTKENLMKCMCSTCSTHNQCMKNKMQGLFCAREKSDCTFEKKGCFCKGCPVAAENKFSGGYFCAMGLAHLT